MVSMFFDFEEGKSKYIYRQLYIIDDVFLCSHIFLKNIYFLETRSFYVVKCSRFVKFLLMGIQERFNIISFVWV